MHQQTSENLLNRAREQIVEQTETIDDQILIGMFRKAILHAIDCHTRLISQVNQFIPDQDDQKQDLGTFDISLQSLGFYQSV